MPKLRDVVSKVRSKNAGPFWVTVDFFFDDEASYVLAKASPELSAERVAERIGLDPAHAKRFALDPLTTIKISAPRDRPQGYRYEHDMHAGQMYTALLGMDL